MITIGTFIFLYLILTLCSMLQITHTSYLRVYWAACYSRDLHVIKGSFMEKRKENRRKEKKERPQIRQWQSHFWVSCSSLRVDIKESRSTEGGTMVENTNQSSFKRFGSMAPDGFPPSRVSQMVQSPRWQSPIRGWGCMARGRSPARMTGGWYFLPFLPQCSMIP